MKNKRIARKPRFSHQYSQQAVVVIVKRKEKEEEEKVRKTNKQTRYTVLIEERNLSTHRAEKNSF